MYKLSPSDFRYLYEDCKHCFYQKVKYCITLPTIGLPGVFSKMNSLLQNTIMGMDLSEINSSLPSGKVEVKEGYLRSTPIPPSKDCLISGRFDFVSQLDDGTYAVIDFKITDPTEDKIQKFFHQLHAYKFALENPAGGASRKISKMGVIAITPEEIEFPQDKIIFTSSPQFFEIKEDMDRFYNFISEVSELLNGSVPKPNQNCAWCKYRICFEKPDAIQEDIPF
ncbi:hypothetical protein A2Z22_01670 [Candidatus Woesebacteria bacterium RBG_16_34_12]|uniref:PD-(D/E)XK endonuclease-like domain-containing protein n=1 Tax=Candidatus Woesebacteria bacterium RBG_16_34_12 TaxID=1802480 RepID=A0A1F7XA76_9BACT|nr:MAG: hypothetical protein A2Z22_01670 [Candidatus Woesebacteria bacterium RBG_16_34_12]